MGLLEVLGIIIILSLVFTFFTLYHLIRFGVGIKPKLTAAVFLAGSIVLLLTVVAVGFLVDLKLAIEELKYYVNFYLLQK